MLSARLRRQPKRSLAYDHRYGLQPRELSWAGVVLFTSLALIASGSLLLGVYSKHSSTRSKKSAPLSKVRENKPQSIQPVSLPQTTDTSEIDVRIQAVLDNWASTHRGQNWGVSIQGTDSTIGTASLNADQTFTAESLYKLFVAYLGYQKVDEGTYSFKDSYLNDWSRGRCLDEMIRNSNSPCAEKMMAELGKPAIDQMNAKYGLARTSMAGLTTSAGDVTALLARLQAGRDLSSSSRDLFLASMLGQEYRTGLPAGFAPLDVYDKVGFRGYDVYHDVGIVALPNNHYLIISTLSENASARAIAQLASQVAASIQP
jgi:beta-lactamase class A